MSAQEDDDEVRRNVRTHLFSSVGELADREFQRATWLDPEMQNPHFAFVEFVERFYDAAGPAYDAVDRDSTHAPLHYALERSYITVAERDTIWPVHEALRDYRHPSGPYDHGAILADPAWHDVCCVAANARTALIGLLTDSAERALLDNLLPTAAAKRWP